MTFGERLKQLRNEQRITQRDLATLVGVDFTYISKIENDRLEHLPSIEAITKFASALNADSDELIILAKKVPNAIRETIIDDDLATAFLRKVSRMSDEQRNRIKEYIDEV